MLSADPWSMEAAVGAGAGAGLGVLLGRCLEICFCLLSSDLETTREEERGNMSCRNEPGSIK